MDTVLETALARRAGGRFAAVHFERMQDQDLDVLVGIIVLCRHLEGSVAGFLDAFAAEADDVVLLALVDGQLEVADRLQRQDACVVSVQMKDRLSDSGVIAVIVASKQGRRLQIEELCISCRAMGRRLEDAIVIDAIRHMPQFAECDEVAFDVVHGPRNQPALTWLSSWLLLKSDVGAGVHVCSAERLRQFAGVEGVCIVRD